MRCIICGNEKEASKEHIVPYALGNRNLVTSDVCKDCNGTMGSHVDNYLIDMMYVKMLRFNKGWHGHKNNAIKVFPKRHNGDDGNQYIFDDGNAPHYVPTKEKVDGSFLFKAETIQECYDLLKKHLVEKGKTEDDIKTILESITVQRSSIPNTGFTFEINIDMGRYCLAAAKIAYEYTYMKMGESYYDDKVAQVYRDEIFEAVKTKKAKDVKPNYEILKEYIQPILASNVEIVLQEYKQVLLELPIKVEHVIILNKDSDDKLICSMFLCWDRFTSFRAIMSENASIYFPDNTDSYIVMIKEDGSVMEL